MAYSASPADIAIYGGQAGGGKTYASLMEAARHTDNPRFGAVIFRRVSPSITDEGGLWDTSHEVFPLLDATPLKSPVHQWVFPSGAKVSFHHLQHEWDKLKWKSAQIPLAIWDQLEEFEEGQFWYLLSRMRAPPGVGIRPYVRATCNPVPPDDPTGGWLHSLIGWWIGKDGYPIEERCGLLRWFYRNDEDLVWFDSEAEALEWAKSADVDTRIRPLSLTFIRAQLEDNPALEKADPAYRSKLASLPRVERMRLLHGNWLIRNVAGELIDRSWFEIVEAAPAAIQSVRYWDKAGTAGGKGAESAGPKIVGPVGGLWYITDIIHGRWGALDRERVIMQAAKMDGPSTIIITEQEPGSGGKESAERTIAMLAGWEVYADRVTGDKVERSGPFRAQAEARNIKLVRADWNDAFLRQAQNFGPEAGIKDMVDAAVGAFNWVSKELNRPIPRISMASALEDTTQIPAWRIE